MQRVWSSPIDTKQGCPQDRESSGHVGIRAKTNHTHLFVCKQTLLSGEVCVHECGSASTSSHFAMDFRIWGGGGVG